MRADSLAVVPVCSAACRTFGAGLKPSCYRVCAARSLPPAPLLSAAVACPTLGDGIGGRVNLPAYGRPPVFAAIQLVLYVRVRVGPPGHAAGRRVVGRWRSDWKPAGRWRGWTWCGRHCIGSARKSLSPRRARVVAPIEVNYSRRAWKTTSTMFDTQRWRHHAIDRS